MTEQSFHADEPTPPAPPPAPPSVAEGARLPGDPRCYYCGARFLREEDVDKTRHALGNGYAIYVMICRECRGKKERGEPPFNQPPANYLGCIIPFVFFSLFAIFMFSQIPGCPPGGKARGADASTSDNCRGTGVTRPHSRTLP
jgi:hypothetical protein